MFARLPISFERNEGQTDNRVKFLTRGSRYNLFLTSTEAVLTLRSSDQSGESSKRDVVRPNAGGRAKSAKHREQHLSYSVVRLTLVGANKSPKIEGLDQLPGKSNYFIGDDPSKWRTDIPTFAKVKYQGVYPGVDAIYYGNKEKLEFDFVIAPRANYRQIRLEYEGAKTLLVDEETGDLVLTLANGTELRQRKPIVYQQISGERRSVESAYRLKGKR